MGMVLGASMFRRVILPHPLLMRLILLLPSHSMIDDENSALSVACSVSDTSRYTAGSLQDTPICKPAVEALQPQQHTRRMPASAAAGESPAPH
jgi:hypothetical protein